MQEHLGGLSMAMANASLVKSFAVRIESIRIGTPHFPTRRNNSYDIKPELDQTSQDSSGSNEPSDPSDPRKEEVVKLKLELACLRGAAEEQRFKVRQLVEENNKLRTKISQNIATEGEVSYGVERMFKEVDDLKRYHDDVTRENRSLKEHTSQLEEQIGSLEKVVQDITVKMSPEEVEKHTSKFQMRWLMGELSSEELEV
eukprot:CAMPEP_0118703278 /NCGR_PEP_ID=MMETSP0800-20121206/18442_1 /TAXON_ID=210618 ORGANISM="Striatella unipunctata, Strain CCMP2910" /NCGR_SAMPLE_ID=MMETSP0800 /ASSEMBLY_ACC=CAM_ASM_000638 /LENGTH=199 /DNA_ID=CAMNT_0006604741 /DNA_START=44 /DNA_END=643 /DNA_ORIENTATION=-